MRLNFFVKTFYGRLIVAFVIVISWSALFLWQPFFKARNIINKQYNQIEASRQEIYKADAPLRLLADPASLATQSPRTFRSYSEDVEKANQKFDVKQIPVPQPVKFPKSWQFGREQIGKVNNLILKNNITKAYQDSFDALTQAKALLTYHSQLIKAVSNVMDYNPAIDFKQFDLKDQDTQGRLNAAAEGLAKTIERIDEAAKIYDDPSLADVKKAVIALQQARDNLAKDGNLDNWKIQVKTQQEIIKKNRSKFWLEQSTIVQQNLTQAEQGLANIARLWLAIKL